MALHPPKDADKLLFKHVLASVDLLAHGVECRLVHAFGLRPDPIPHANLDAQLPAQRPCAASGSVIHLLAPGHVGKIMAATAKEQPTGAIEVFASFAAVRAEEQCRLTASGAGEPDDGDGLFGWLPLAAIQSKAKVQVQEPIVESDADPVNFAVIAGPFPAAQIAFTEHALAAHQARIDPAVVLHHARMPRVPAAAAEPSHHAILAWICRNRLPSRTGVRFR